MTARRRLLCRVLLGLTAALFSLAAGLAWSGLGRAQALVADLSSHLIAITTGFTGTEVVLFGATDGPGEVAVVVEGPPSEVVVRRKGRIAGIWINRESVTFRQVPSFYSVATSRPLDDLVEQAVLDRHEIGLDHLRLEPVTPVPPDALTEFRTALIRGKQREGLYSVNPGQVIFLGERLFRTNIFFPANVPTGAYTVSVYLIRDGDVVSAQTTPLQVSKIGFSAEVFEFARRQSMLYGVFTVAIAVGTGWLAGVAFRKV